MPERCAYGLTICKKSGCILINDIETQFDYGQEGSHTEPLSDQNKQSLLNNTTAMVDKCDKPDELKATIFKYQKKLPKPQ
jgi:hypothetical protein